MRYKIKTITSKSMGEEKIRLRLIEMVSEMDGGQVAKLYAIARQMHKKVNK